MHSRRDQIQAHRFVSRRVTAGIVDGETASPHPPLRRFSVGLVVGVALAMLAVAGTAAFGLISPARSTAWRQSSTLIIEKQTGNRYLYLDGALHPVLNLASARLLLGDKFSTTTVSSSSLAGTPHGRPVGIAGGPTVLPTAGEVDTASWTVCAPDAGHTWAAVGLPALPGAVLGPDQALLTTGPDGVDYLIWHGDRLRVAGDAARLGLKLVGVPTVSVAASWLNAVPAGPDLAAPDIAGSGTQGPDVGGVPTRVGELFDAQNAAGGTDYVVTRQGLTPITPVQAALLRGASSAPPAVLSQQQLSAVSITAPLPAPTGEPSTLPTPVTVPAAGATADTPTEPCLIGTPSGGALSTQLRLVAPALVAGAGAWSAPDPSAGGSADRILVAPDSGALVTDGQGDFGTALVTDDGVRFPLGAGAGALLGYQNSAPTQVPAGMLALLPVGPRLSAAAAGVVQPDGGS